MIRDTFQILDEDLQSSSGPNPQLCQKSFEEGDVPRDASVLCYVLSLIVKPFRMRKVEVIGAIHSRTMQTEHWLESTLGRRFHDGSIQFNTDASPKTSKDLWPLR